MCSSTRSRGLPEPVRRRCRCRAPSPSSASASASPETRCRVSATGKTRAGDQVGARARGLDRVARGRRPPRPGSRGRPAARVASATARHELARLVRLRATPVGSWSSARAAPSSGSSRACSTSASAARPSARAVDEPRVELLAGADDRLARLAQVRDVVQRVVEPEDVDAVLGRRGDEAAHEVGADRPRADEEAAAERQPERRLRAGLERPDPLPGALDAAPHGRVEDTAARDLEVRRSRRRRGSPRARKISAVGMRPRAAPARAAGWSCRPGAARAEPSSRVDGCAEAPSRKVTPARGGGRTAGGRGRT